MRKTRKKAEQYEVLLSGEFWGHDIWTEYLCMERNQDGRITTYSSTYGAAAVIGYQRRRIPDRTGPARPEANLFAE